ncbi:SH3 domain-containing protein [Aestuariimicrobium soli]|uniref:SH3 domain-containing protein n=1 Tax=Aestuariimicrobium soli TaxID=2035834 RepID=UPI003EC0D529
MLRPPVSLRRPISLRPLRLAVSALGLAGAIAASSVAIGPSAIADYSTLRATTAVNVRTKPSTTAPIIGVLYLGGTVKQTGPVSNGWVPVTFNGRSAWVSANYLTGVRATESAPVSQAGTTGTRTVTEALNVRTGPTVTSRKVGLLQRGSTVTLTGLVNASYSQIQWQDGRAWVATAWLGSPGTSSGSVSTPSAKSQGRATADLMIRTSSGTNFTSLGDIPKGTILNLTGKKATGVVEIIWQGALRWVNANYVAPISTSPVVTTPTLPKIIGTQYATAALDIRTTSGSDSKTITEVPIGTALSVTGVVQNGRAQIVYQGAVRWVTARYLSSTKPLGNLDPTYGGSVGLVGLPNNTYQLLVTVRSTWPQIKTIYGIRPDTIPDHPSGHALDLMLPSWSTSSGNAQGWEIAKWARANANSLDIQYIIFDQHIWNRDRDSEGWRLMADRGGATANHKDHVHITTRS